MVVATNGEASIEHVTGYVTETVNLFFPRSANDSSSTFRKYAVWINKTITIALGKENDGKDKFLCIENSTYSVICQERFSFHYVNSSYISLRIRSVTFQDAGQYVCQTYFSQAGAGKDPRYEHVQLTVREKPTIRTKEIMSPTAPRSTSPHSEKTAVRPKETNFTIVSRATSHHSGIFQPFFCVLMVVTILLQALFY